jgi:hypothetical protein
MAAAGIQTDRDYLSLMPFERFDTMSGALVLQFTDLVLPGNAGRELRFQRTYSSKSQSWTIGVAGLATGIDEPWLPGGGGPQISTPTLVMSEEIISRFKKGSIRSVFPSEYLHTTLAEIRRLAASGDRAAKTALKLLTDGRFNK